MAVQERFKKGTGLGNTDHWIHILEAIRAEAKLNQA
jgi:hypothetical protein